MGRLDGAARYGRGEDEHGGGGDVGGEFVYGFFECFGRCYTDFEQKGIFAGYAMALEDFGHLAHGCRGAGNEVADDAHTNEGADRQADFVAIDFDAVAGDDAGLFHAAHALNDGRRGEADALAQLDKLHASVFLQLGENAPADGVKEFRNF